ncbi:hypothetical protein [Stenotrophomonas sp. BIGb0135]|jgi:hypothetical protein|uniref:hypothetical protein n=1 Tax=Stenotrophomonas sp. BIGb0135 TaxID=2940620 RepID=UPI00216A2DB2|nr:hypothetical protein [Stenotrophomonas sp. BIGb0135]MCS4234244.1 hypothetical protein [Stenotrophomonas sp. BIGb0135]
MALALLFAAGAPGSFWASPSNVSGVVWVLIGLAGIAFSLVLAKALKRFNGLVWALLLAGIGIGVYGAWRLGS